MKMTNKELNSWNQEAEERIIKALKKILELMCYEGDLQRSAIISKSLDLINRLQRENGKNEKIIKAADRLIETQKAEIERLERENERLAEDWSNVTIEKDLLFDEAKALIEKAKAEAVKEFAGRLCEGRVSNDPVVIAVKVELEMVGEQRKEDEGK